jgi:hypothetical protein
MRKQNSFTMSPIPVLATVLVSICILMSGCGGSSSSKSSTPPAATPVFSSTPPTSAIQGTTYAYTLTATDPTGGTVSFALTSGPGTISGKTLTWTPTAAQTGVSDSFTVTATTSEGGSATQNWSVTPATGPAPAFTSTAPTSAEEAVSYSYGLAATDALGGTVSFALTSGPGAVSGDTLTWTPTHAQSRTADSFTVTATTSEGGSATQNWTVTPSGTINGSYTVTNVLASGTTVVVNSDLSSLPINVLLPNGSGGYTTIQGTGYPNGTFTVLGVPAGVFWMQVGNIYNQVLVSDFNFANLPDVATYVGGRTGITYGGGATISLTASGFPDATTQVCDDWWVPNLNESQSAGCPGVSGGALAETIDLSALMDSTQGDAGYYVANAISPAYTGEQTLTTSAYDFGPVPVTATSGSNVPVTGVVAAITGLQSTEVAVQRSAFAAFRTLANPGFNSGATTHFYVQPQLYGDLYGPIFYAEPNALNFVDYTGETTDIDLGSIQFGVFDATEPLRYGASDYTANISMVGGGTLTQSGGVLVDSSSAFTSAAPATPGISPVASPLINGTSFFQSQTGVSPTPTLTWNAPSLGTANYYQVLVYESVLTDTCPPNGCFYWLMPPQATANFFTVDTQLIIPPGVLAAGGSYQFYIESLSAPGINLLNQQATVSLNLAQAYSESGLITVGSDDKAGAVNEPRSPSPAGISRELYGIQPQVQPRAHGTAQTGHTADK